MNVKLAAQIMSATVASALEQKYGDYVGETVKFIQIVNKWFDFVNVKNLQEHATNRNPHLKPFTSANDWRLDWLENDFLNYFEARKISVQNRDCDYTVSELAKMQLLYQTLQGFSITSKSIVACVKFMLGVGEQFVLTSAFNRDKIEQFSGLLRMRGGANPNVNIAGRLINKMHFIRTNQFQNVRGNAQAGIQRVIDNNPLPKRHRDRSTCCFQCSHYA